ncbi:hypothetical protein [Bifidobacterium magnum]|uniref:Uncharacterized protein n=1 Tax=Bifidobacterium magnum TaxID=1692 RepID=A0A087BE90_9BIFI|nr:hypothetical protein [Bifidobacterium magnum]KFI69340.1 hypothetical protein BMAGN_1114 [Bifidobacterium magnum]
MTTNDATAIRPWIVRSVAPGGFFDRHPVLTPALVLSACWVPYVVALLRSSITFGLAHSVPVPLRSPWYWVLLAFELFVCVVSHSLAVRTIVRLRGPNWLIWGSLAFFGLFPVWGMLTAADIRYPLFAMMICVATSSCAFIVYGAAQNVRTWLQLFGSSILIVWLDAYGWWIAAATWAAALGYTLAQKRYHTWAHANREGRVCSWLALGTVVAGIVLIVGTSTSTRFGFPVGSAGQHPVSVPMTEGISHAAQNVESWLSLWMHTPIYVVLFVGFVAYAIWKRRGDALVVATPQIAIVVIGACTGHIGTLAFLLPVLAAQIMFFGAALGAQKIVPKGC